MAERHLAPVFIACHNHACYPEEDDIWPSNKVACGIIIVYFLVVWIKYSVEE